MTSIELSEFFPIARSGFWKRPSSASPREGARRALNVTVAAVGLIVSAPVMIVIAVLVKLTSRGPVFYSQMRVGVDRRTPLDPDGNSRRKANQGGRPFRIFKFRTMATNHGDAQVWARPDDPRVTPLGRVLRKYRLDEIPQLFNVLLGDMNIVGPRPEQPQIFAALCEQIDRYPERQRVRPGITGWAQINQHYDSCMEDVKRKVALDLEYVSRQSVIHDLEIMLRTGPVMVFRKGAW